MRSLICASVLVLAASAANAETYATGNCVTQYGHTMEWYVHEGNGIIRHDGKPWDYVFSSSDGKTAIIKQVGNVGDMTIAVDISTGRGYAITKFDDGRKVETNLSCRLGLTER